MTQTTERVIYALPFVPKTAQMENAGPVLRRTAGYARVSTKEEEQQNSYEAQIEYYTKYIQAHEGWIFIDMYADEGITGTSIRKRKDFNRMVQDAMDGKLDLIVTKSVSRFARNTVDTLTTVRQLKEKGVEVFFEEQNIYTFDPKCELLLTIMSSVAQEEARSISENVRWGLRKRMKDGKIILPYKQFLGYEKGEDGIPQIVEKEARLVKRIYTLFLDGMTPSGIAKLLTTQKIPSPAGKKKWEPSTVKSILTNEKYRGSALLQKTYTVDFLTKETKVNEGEVQQYYIEKSHPAIIPPEVFELVQYEMKARMSDARRLSNVSIFSNRLVCGECGSYYGRKVWHSTSKYRRVIWQCGHKFKNGEKCTTPHLHEENIKAAFLVVMERLVQNRAEILVTLEQALAILADTRDIDRKIERSVKKEQEVAQLMRSEVEQNARVVQDQVVYNERYSELTERYNAAHAEVVRLTEAKADRQGRMLKLTAFLETLRDKDSLVPELNDGLWNAVVQDVTVRADGTMTFRLRDGSEMECVL